jgi:hypothetical protein
MTAEKKKNKRVALVTEPTGVLDLRLAASWLN